MSAMPTVPHSLQHCNFVPITPRHGVVTLFGYGISVSVDRGHLVLKSGIGGDRCEGRFARVGHRLRRLVVIGSDGMVSLAALRWLADQDTAFVMLDRVGEVLAVTGPVRPSDARLRRAQSLAQESGAALRIAKELIRQKLIGQERLVRDQFQDDNSTVAISDARQALMKTKSSEEIRRYEAHAALAYWRAWHELPVAFPQADSRRVPEHWLTFGSRLSPLTRSPRLAVNPANAMLNYLYAILESEARLAIAELGLDPGLGVLHADTRNRDSLACDLMEPIRPQVDAFLLSWLRRAPLQRKCFFEERDGNCRLMSDFAARLSETSKIWRQALGPLAEWIAHTLWTNASQPSRAKAPATRLTQNRKREAKGIPTTTPVVSVANPVTSYRGFASMVSRENSFEVRNPVRLNAYDPIAQARRADSQRRQAAALKVWRPSDKPEWLDEKFYLKNIQPRVAGIKIPVLTSALRISKPYATAIRAGRRPHPRHWLRLAQMVGLTEDSGAEDRQECKIQHSSS
jgi:CRISPR-associated endonuclease Cas1